MIKRQGAEPVYVQVADALRERIAGGEWPPGDQLPAEPDLAHAYDVGKDTIRDALAILVNEGLIVTRRGYRAKVREALDKEPVTPEPGSIVIVRMPNRDERETFSIGAGTPVFVVVDESGAGQAYPADRYQLRITNPDQPLPE